MKKVILLLTLFYFFNSWVRALEKADAMALTSVGLLSSSLFCTLEAAQSHMESWDTQDPYQKRALVICGNTWLKGAVFTGIPGFALLSKAAAEKTECSKVMACGFAASAMFALSGTFFKHAQKCHEEFNRTENITFANQRDKSKYMLVMCAMAGTIFCIPVIQQQ